MWADSVSGPPTFGHLIRPKKYPICVLKGELFSDERVALTNHTGYYRPLNSSTARPNCNGTSGSILLQALASSLYVRSYSKTRRKLRCRNLKRHKPRMEWQF